MQYAYWTEGQRICGYEMQIKMRLETLAKVHNKSTEHIQRGTLKQI